MKKLSLLIILFSLLLTAFNSNAQTLAAYRNETYTLATPKADLDMVIIGASVSGNGVSLISCDKNYTKLNFSQIGLIDVILTMSVIVTPIAGEFIQVTHSFNYRFNVIDRPAIDDNITVNLTSIAGHNQTYPGRRETYIASHPGISFSNITYIGISV